MTDKTPDSPQQAGAEIEKRCGNCACRALELTASDTEAMQQALRCGCSASPKWFKLVAPSDSCKRFADGGAE